MLDLLAGLFVVFCVAATLGVVAAQFLTGDTTPPKPEPKPYIHPDTLMYCAGCGCRHLRINMDWRHYGEQYRCVVCCRDKV